MGAANVSAPTFSNTTPGSILEMRLVNTGNTINPAGSTTTLGTFTKGEVPAGSGIQALVNGQLVTAQIDVKTRHADGSAETGVVTFQHDKIAAGGAVDIVLLRSDAAPAPALDLAARMDSYSLIAKVDPVGSAPEVSIDLAAALKAAIANGTADFWQKGAEATGARVEVPMGGSMRLVADITATADGNVKASVQFANDIAMGATGGTQQFKATVVENGVTKFQHDVTEVQYQSFRAQVSTAGDDSLHLQHDIQNLIATGMVANYDVAMGVSESLLKALGADAAAPGFTDPLATAGVTQYMPMTGGRSDIGMTTMQNTAWLISQDVRAADAALGQAEAAATVPWRMWDAANGTWLNTDNYPKLWNDGRGGVGKPGDVNSGGLTQQSENGGWTPETAHQPDLSYVPYLMTGDRFHLENVQAQAAWSIMSHWTWPRGDANDLVVKDTQVRGAAWSLRELVEAAAISPDGSKEMAYFTA